MRALFGRARTFRLCPSAAGDCHANAALSVSEPSARGHCAGNTPLDGCAHAEHNRHGHCGSGISSESSTDRLVRLLIRDRFSSTLSSREEPRASPPQLSTRSPQSNSLRSSSGPAMGQHGGPVFGDVAARRRDDPGRACCRHGRQRHNLAVGHTRGSNQLHVRNLAPGRGEVPSPPQPEGLPAPRSVGPQLLVVPGRPHRQDQARDQRARAGRCCAQGE